MRKYEIYKVTLKPDESERLKHFIQEFETVNSVGEFEGQTPKKAIDTMGNSENFTGFDSGEFFFAVASSSNLVNERLKLPNQVRFAYLVGRKLYQPPKKVIGF